MAQNDNLKFTSETNRQYDKLHAKLNKTGKDIRDNELNKEANPEKGEECSDNMDKANFIAEQHSSILMQVSQHQQLDNAGYKMEKFVHEFVSLRRQILISCCIYIGFLADGYSVGWPAPVLIKLQNSTQTPLPNEISDTVGSWLASMIFFGVIGSYPAGYLSNIIGRKPCLIIGGFLMISAYLILTFSSNIYMMYFGRFMTGVGQSFSTIASLIYIGEISSPKIRGTLLTLTGVCHNIGALTVYCVGPFTSYQGLNFVTVGIAAIFIIACCFIPETPVFYIVKGLLNKFPTSHKIPIN